MDHETRETTHSKESISSSLLQFGPAYLGSLGSMTLQCSRESEQTECNSQRELRGCKIMSACPASEAELPVHETLMLLLHPDTLEPLHQKILLDPDTLTAAHPSLYLSRVTVASQEGSKGKSFVTSTTEEIILLSKQETQPPGAMTDILQALATAPVLASQAVERGVNPFNGVHATRQETGTVRSSKEVKSLDESKNPELDLDRHEHLLADADQVQAPQEVTGQVAIPESELYPRVKLSPASKSARIRLGASAQPGPGTGGVHCRVDDSFAASDQTQDVPGCTGHTSPESNSAPLESKLNPSVKPITANTATRTTPQIGASAQSGTSVKCNQSIPSESVPSAAPVEMQMTLNIDLKEAGTEGSEQRKAFMSGVAADLAKAAGVSPANFNVQVISFQDEHTAAAPLPLPHQLPAPHPGTMEGARASLPPSSETVDLFYTPDFTPDVDDLPVNALSRPANTHMAVARFDDEQEIVFARSEITEEKGVENKYDTFLKTSSVPVDHPSLVRVPSVALVNGYVLVLDDTVTEENGVEDKKDAYREKTSVPVDSSSVVPSVALVDGHVLVLDVADERGQARVYSQANVLRGAVERARYAVDRSKLVLEGGGGGGGEAGSGAGSGSAAGEGESGGGEAHELGGSQVAAGDRDTLQAPPLSPPLVPHTPKGPNTTPPVRRSGRHGVGAQV